MISRLTCCSENFARHVVFTQVFATAVCGCESQVLLMRVAALRHFLLEK